MLVAMTLCLLPVVSTGQRDTQREVTEIAQWLRLSETTILADVGAGGGEWTLLLAPRVNRVFATDVKSPQVNGIENVARNRGITNVSVILGTQEETGLAANCCDAMLLCLVYHAFRNPPMMRESLRRTLRTGGYPFELWMSVAIGCDVLASRSSWLLCQSVTQTKGSRSLC
jgi:ubiquinone/menaquinone biosynthesis C-methylase UbiE